MKKALLLLTLAACGEHPIAKYHLAAKGSEASIGRHVTRTVEKGRNVLTTDAKLETKTAVEVFGLYAFQDCYPAKKDIKDRRVEVLYTPRGAYNGTRVSGVVSCLATAAR